MLQKDIKHHAYVTEFHSTEDECPFSIPFDEPSQNRWEFVQIACKITTLTKFYISFLS